MPADAVALRADDRRFSRCGAPPAPPFGGGLQTNASGSQGGAVCSPATVDLRVQAACRPAANGGACNTTST